MTRNAILSLAHDPGRSYREIGEAVGVSAQWAWQCTRDHAPELFASRKIERNRHAARTCQWAPCSREFRTYRAGQKYCQRECLRQARLASNPNSYRARAYALRMTGMKWREIAASLGMSSPAHAINEARGYAKLRNLEWPVKRRARDE